jgi:hypothetical protein
MKSDFAKRADRVKQQDIKYREMPDIVVKVHCRYRAELFFKISRKTKLSRLLSSWTERMDLAENASLLNGTNGSGRDSSTNASPASTPAPSLTGGMQFIFTFNGRMLDPDQTPEDIGIEEGDEIIAVEMMDLTEGDGGGSEDWVRNKQLEGCRHAAYIY